MNPINPRASTEASELLKFIYSISGKRILSGQHNFPGGISSYSDDAASVGGAYPAVWGQDFGFSADDQDGVQFRERVIAEAIRQHEKGSIVTLMWHAVRPNMEEPGVFQGDVIAKLTDEEWTDLLSQGTDIYERWFRQATVVAELLQKLKEAKVPVLWRPYHEMNGDWFWWCGRRGPDGYSRLWLQLYRLFTEQYDLNNLIWVWNANAPRGNAGPYSDYFPGLDVVDILATDVYANDYRQENYSTLVDLAKGKPVALGEVGQMPTPELLLEQPLYAWFMTWSGFVKENDAAEVRRLYQDERTLNHPARS